MRVACKIFKYHLRIQLVSFGLLGREIDVFTMLRSSILPPSSWRLNVIQVDAEVVGKTRKYLYHTAWKPKRRPPTDQQPLW